MHFKMHLKIVFKWSNIWKLSELVHYTEPKDLSSQVWAALRVTDVKALCSPVFPAGVWGELEGLVLES